MAKQKIILTLLLFLTALPLWSQTLIDGIYYDLSGTSATVDAKSGVRYSGDIIIPETVTYEGTTYSVTAIGYGAFSDSSLSSITIPNSVASIGRRAFYYCTWLSSVTIGNGVTFIDSEVFLGCRNLRAINVDPENTSYASDNGALFNKDKTKLLLFPKAKNGSYVIPNSMTTIERYAFSNCRNLSSVTIPDGVTSIEEAAFRDCTSLTTINIPDSIITINSDTFYGCESLSSVTISGGVTSIGKDAFSDCDKLSFKHLNIPNAEIETRAFNGVKIDSLSAKALKNKAKSILLADSIKYIAINKSCESMPNEVFEDCFSLQSLTIPFVGLNTTAGGADVTLGALFGTSSNSNMKAVTQYYSATGSKTYYMPQNLEKLTITSPATRLEYGALYNCSSIKELTLSSSVTGVSEKALYGCSGLEHVYAQRALPPGCFENSFEGVNFSAILHVPSSSKQYYEKATGWKNFFFIQEEAPLLVTTAAVPLNGGLIVGSSTYERGDMAEMRDRKSTR